LPLAALDDTEDFNDLESLGNHASAEATSRVLHGCLKNANEVFVLEGTIGLTLEAIKGSDTGVLGGVGLKGQKSLSKFSPADVLKVLCLAAREKLEEEVIDPALVSLGDTRVEAVEKVELNADLVTDTTRDTITIELLVNSNTRVQSPVTGGVVCVGDGSKIVVKADVDVQTTCDEASHVEEIVVLLGNRLGLVFFSGVGWCRQREAPVLVYLEQDVRNIVVETTVEDKHNVDTGRLTQETLLVEGVRLELTLFHGTDFKLIFERRSIQRCKVKV
jgi:hypothetical protein